MGSNPRWHRRVRRRVCRTSTQALGRVLDVAEDASPLEAVEAVTARRSAALEASAAFFLIADISGRGLVRLSQACAGPTGVRAEVGGPGARRGSTTTSRPRIFRLPAAAPPARRCGPRRSRSCHPGAGVARADGGRCWRR